jgi:hypothetical protein
MVTSILLFEQNQIFMVIKQRMIHKEAKETRVIERIIVVVVVE